MDKLTDEILTSITKTTPFTKDKVKAVYDRCNSYDKTAKICIDAMSLSEDPMYILDIIERYNIKKPTSI